MSKREQDAYKKGAVIGITLGLPILIFSIFFPIKVEGFWPFIITRASEAHEPVLHDASLPLLSAAVNPDPNPYKAGYELPVSGGVALIGNAGPQGDATPYIENVPNSGQISLHVVRDGESLSVIASLYNVSINTILWANDIKDAKTIQPGDTLLILPVTGVQHKVQKGETVASVAKKYDADVDEIIAFNGLEEGVALSAGDILIIPGGDLAPKPSTKSSGTKKTGGASSKALPTLTGYFGNPLPGAYRSQGIHGYNGVDLAGMPMGSPVYAAAGGTVIVAKANGGYNGGYGNYIVISHDNGTQTLYAHLSSVAVSVGATVAKGDLIGGVGNTGRSTGIHLHFEVRGAKNPFAN